MKKTESFKNVIINSTGKKMYEDILHKNLFDKEHTKPLIGVREFTVNHLFANIWHRSAGEVDEERNITIRERRLITIALLAGQGRNDQLIEHVTGASLAGIKELTLIEVMIHVAHYSGWPAGSSGQKVVQDIYKKFNRRKRKPNAKS